MKERRFFKRVGFDKLVRCNMLGSDGVYDTIKSSMNISGGGICIETDSCFAPFGDISIEINLPGYYKSIPAKGEIVWMNEMGNNRLAGIKFTDIGSFERQMILDYIHFG